MRERLKCMDKRNKTVWCKFGGADSNQGGAVIKAGN